MTNPYAHTVSRTYPHAPTEITPTGLRHGGGTRPGLPAVPPVGPQVSPWFAADDFGPLPDGIPVIAFNPQITRAVWRKLRAEGLPTGGRETFPGLATPKLVTRRFLDGIPPVVSGARERLATLGGFPAVAYTRIYFASEGADYSCVHDTWTFQTPANGGARNEASARYLFSRFVVRADRAIFVGALARGIFEVTPEAWETAEGARALGLAPSSVLTTDGGPPPLRSARYGFVDRDEVRPPVRVDDTRVPGLVGGFKG